MLSHISWVSFWITIGCVASAWYLLMGFYYAKDFRRLLQTHFTSIVYPNKNEPGSEQKNEDPFVLAQTLRNEIAELFQQAAHWRNPKEEIIMALQLQVRRYPQLKDAALRLAINNYISQEGEKQCSVNFSEKELQLVWTG